MQGIFVAAQKLFFPQDQDLQLLLGPRTCAVSSTQMVAGAVIYTLQTEDRPFEIVHGTQHSPLRLL